jgi:2-iminobutanoate/2-iminopropanoate deaminase
MRKQEIKSKKAPLPVGPYSQAVKFGKLLFCSGQIGLDPRSGNLVKGDIEKETIQVFENLSAVLLAGKADLKNVLKVEIFLTDINDFGKVNEIYAKYFNGKVKPARLIVEVSRLPKGASIEISCIAYVNK